MLTSIYWRADSTSHSVKAGAPQEPSGCLSFQRGPSRSPSHTRCVHDSRITPTHPRGDFQLKEEAKGKYVCRGAFSRELNQLQAPEKPKII